MAIGSGAYPPIAAETGIFRGARDANRRCAERVAGEGLTRFVALKVDEDLSADLLRRQLQELRAEGRAADRVLYLLLGYSAVGALAATAMQSLAWLTSQTVVLKPVWTLFHLALLGWGLLLLTTARQPAWVETAGRALWARVQPLARAPGGLLATGALWALVPCGLLYSALLVAALSGGPLQGALAMALAKELGPRNIRVNVVAPGVLEAGASRLLPDDLRAQYLRHSGSKRLGRLEEIANLCTFLLLDNTYVTGQTIVADGGL